MLDEVYYQLNKGDEFVVAWANESLSPTFVHDAYRRIVKKGIKYRKLIKQGDTNIYGPLSWYRYVQPRYFLNAAAFFYNDKSVYLAENSKKVIVIRDRTITRANKNFFDLFWSLGATPKISTAPDRY
jgi:hypothetical protein